MDFMKLFVLMLIELLHTSQQVNDHLEGMNTFLDKLIKDTESHFSYNKTTIHQEKINKNLNDSKIVYLKTKMKPDVLLKPNMSKNSSEEKNPLEDKKTVKNEDDEIKKISEYDLPKSDHTANSRRTFDGSHSDEFFSEIIEENFTSVDEGEDMIYEKEITYDITENKQNNSVPSIKLSSLIDAVTRSGSRIEEDVIDKMADLAEDTKNLDPQPNDENVSKSDIVKVLHNYNILNKFDKGDKEKNNDLDKQQLLSLIIYKLHSQSATNQQLKPGPSGSFNGSPILGSNFNELFDQIVNNEKLKSILESLKISKQHSTKSHKNVFPELDSERMKEILKLLEQWDKTYNIFHFPELQQNTTKSKPRRPEEYPDYDIYRIGFGNIPNRGHLYQVPNTHFIPPLPNPRFIFPTKNKIKCCTHTNVIRNPLLGILPMERLGLINSVNRMTSGFVYNPFYYPY